MAARIALRWLAGRTGRPSLNLLVQVGAASAAALGFDKVLVEAPISGALGLLAASRSGIYMAEVARPVRPVEVAATRGSMLRTLLGYLAGAALFATPVSLTGCWTFAFAAAAGQLGVVGLCASPALRRASGQH